MADKTPGIIWPETGRRVYKENLDYEQEAKGQAIVDRTGDFLSHGVQSGGDVSVAGASLIAVAATVAVDDEGRRIVVPATQQVNVTDGSWAVVLRHVFAQADGNTPDLSGQAVQHRSDSFQVLLRATVQAGDVPLRAITVAGGVVTLGADLRVRRDMAVSGNLAVGGAVDVAGATTFRGPVSMLGGNPVVIETTNVETTDNEITLNKGEIGAGVTAGASGVRVKRGSLADALFRFVESDDRFYAGIEGALEKLAYLSEVYTRSQLDAFFEGESAGKKQVHWNRLVGAPMRPGQIILTPEIITLSPTDPFFDLTSPTQDLTFAHFPDLAPMMRNKLGRVKIWNGTDWVWYDSFAVGASYSGNGAVVTLAVANNAQNQVLLKGMAEALLYGWTGLGCIRPDQAIGNIPVDDYAITAVDSAGMTISVACTVTTGTPSGGTFKFYPNRIVGQSSAFRHHQLTELGFMLSGGRIVDGLPVRDQMQYVKYADESPVFYRLPDNVGYSGVSTAPPLYGTHKYNVDQNFTAREVPGYGAPRQGAKTTGPGLGSNAYYFCGTYVA